MSVNVQKNGSNLDVTIQKQRVDGDNDILDALKNGNFVTPDVTAVSIDFGQVEFINSLGITEIVNIHRMFSDSGGPDVQFRFQNVDKKVNAILELVEIQKIAEIEVKI